MVPVAGRGMDHWGKECTKFKLFSDGIMEVFSLGSCRVVAMELQDGLLCWELKI